MVAAATVWLGIFNFTEEQEALKGVDGERFDLQRELTLNLFVRTRCAMPKGKAVGQSGFAVEMLTAFIGGGCRRRREALKGEEVQAGRRGDKRGRWAVEGILEVRRARQATGRARTLERRGCRGATIG